MMDHWIEDEKNGYLRWHMIQLEKDNIEYFLILSVMKEKNQSIEKSQCFLRKPFVETKQNSIQSSPTYDINYIFLIIMSRK